MTGSGMNLLSEACTAVSIVKALLNSLVSRLMKDPSRQGFISDMAERYRHHPDTILYHVVIGKEKKGTEKKESTCENATVYSRCVKLEHAFSRN